MNHEIPVNQPWLTSLEEKYVADALASGWLTTGPYVHRFEREFAAWVGRRHAVACSSGTSALFLALKALGLATPDRVLVPAYTCDAVAAAAILATGQPPVIVDVDETTWGLRWDLAREALNQTTAIRAVIYAHTYGVPARDTDALVRLCADRGVPLIEDGSEAHGAEVRGQRVGRFGTVGVFSCRGEKTLGAGQMGVLVADDEVVARRARQWAQNGLPVDRLRFWATVPGLNMQPANLHAAVACAQLERADELIAARNRVHQGWLERLVGYRGLSFQRFTDLSTPAWWITAVRIGRAFTGLLPQDLGLALGELGIQTRPGFYGLHRLPHVASDAECPVADALLRELLILPSGPDLTPAQQDRVVDAMLDVVGRCDG